LLWSEQGVADTLQFVRYAPLLRAGRIILQCPPQLTALLDGAPGLDEVVPVGAPLPSFDVHLPLADAMQRLGTTLDTIPAPIPYLRPDAGRAAALAPLFAGSGLKVGLIWSGTSERDRALPLAALRPLMDIPGARFFSLQQDGRAEIEQEGLAARVTDLGARLGDFADLAAASAHLDLIVTVDGGAAHLAGALGRPAWVMLPANPEWHWFLGRPDSPWYPSLRLFRQAQPGAWRPVIDEVAAALARTVLQDGKPARPEICNNLGIALRRLGHLEDAIAAYRQALTLRPDYPLALNNLGLALQEAGDYEDAVTVLQRVVEATPGDADAHNNLGAAHDRAGARDQALAHYRRAVALRPDYPEALNNLGLAALADGRLDEAEGALRSALEVRPDYPEIHKNLALVLFARGDLRAGSAEYEWRWRIPRDHRLPNLAAPLWDGRPLGADSTLLLCAEQGLGDTIQFARYAAALHAFAGRVILYGPAPLARIMATVPGLDGFVAVGQELPACDAYLPVMSLMHRLGTTLDTIPAALPYVAPDAERLAALAPLFAGPGLKVGLVWAGDPGHRNDRYRSLTLAALQPILDIPGARFFSLQVGPGAAAIKEAGFGARIVDLAPDLPDLAATAAAMAQLDLVVTVDTAAAHLAGALGRPTWMMLPANPDWRWMTGRSDSPWYPSLRLFRQRHLGEWRPVIEAVALELARLVLREAPPTRPELLNNLGIQFRRFGQGDEAIACYHHALEIRPTYPLALNNLGLALQDAGKLDEAVAAHERAVAADPRYAHGHNNLGVALDKAGRHEAAIAHYRRAIEIRPDYADALSNIANALRADGKLDEAVAYHRRALAQQPDHPEVLNNLGHALRSRGDLDEARVCFEHALAVSPDFVSAHVNLGLTLMTGGDLPRGSAEYEWRWRGFRDVRLPDFKAPFWDGAVLGDDKTLLLWPEQGFGDIIQFIRFAPLLRRFAGRLVLLCPAPLAPLMRNARGIDQVVAAGEPLPAFDAYVPLLSLVQRLGTSLDTIPADIPYLATDPARLAETAPLLGGTGFKVGLVWSGNPKHGNDRHRSLALSALAPLLEVPGTRFFSLQVGPRAEDIREAGFDDRITDLRPYLHDFADTAALVSQLDLVITIDTAAAHLAGALGRPTWVLLPSCPDWRWLLRRSDSPWYPSLRLFRQTAFGDWAPVIAEVAAELRRRVPKPEVELAASADTLNALGCRLGSEGKLAEAEACFRRALSLAPDHVEALTNLGGTLRNRGHLAEAAECFHRVLALRPRHVAALVNLGIVLSSQGDERTAIEHLRQALALEPNHAQAHNTLGVALLAQNQLAAAAASFRRALELRPDYVEALANLGNALRQQDEIAAAEACQRRALALRPGNLEILTNLGDIFLDRGRLDEAAATYRTVLAAEPGHAGALNNLANVLRVEGRLEDAEAMFRQALAAKPEHALIHFNLAMTLLLQGKFAEGAREYEWRWRVPRDFRLPDFPAPLWDGAPLGPDKTLLLWAEQGYGDAIQFVRYAPLLRRYAGRLVLACPQPLAPLLAGAEGIDGIVTPGDGLPPVDAYIPLLSLMQRLGTTLETIPATVPYLVPDGGRSARFAHLLGTHATAGEVKVGLVWAGDPKHRNDRHRSLTLAELHPLLDVAGVRFFSVQTGERASEIADCALEHRIVDLAPHLGDFADTAAALGQLDLLITVDTAAAHLAGALGRPTWMMVPANSDWRWLSGRTDTPWYPSLYLFRQKELGDWAPVIASVADCLAAALPAQPEHALEMPADTARPAAQ
jgi:tetratricopeptide (TPR) repeat protein